jgi:hypothetical protein
LHTDGTIVIVKAELIYRTRESFEDGAILEIVIWQVPSPVHGCKHLFKYRLYYGRDGRREIGYDNERGKGDHRHCDETQERYVFETPEQLINDFFRDVETRRTKR